MCGACSAFVEPDTRPLDVQVADAVFGMKSAEVPSIGNEGMAEEEEYGRMVKVEPEPEVEVPAEADGFLRENGEIVGDIYGRYQKSSPFRYAFIETERGFLRLDLVQRFEFWEAPDGGWGVEAHVDIGRAYTVGRFKSEEEARAAVIRMIEV